MTAAELLAVLLAAGAAALAVPDIAAAAPPGRGPRSRARPGRVLVGSGAVVVVGLAATVEGLHLVLALIVLTAVGAAASLVHRSRRNAAADRRRALVVDVAEALTGELRAGQPLLASLEHCVELWADFETVAATARLGADVPGALRRLAATAGAEGLDEVASAWQVSERSGAGLATALGQVAETARARQATRHLVQGELASAQATARLVAVLPIASLAMSAGIGGHPWQFLLGTAPGLGCLGAGLLCAFAGLLWIDRIALSVLGG